MAAAGSVPARMESLQQGFSENAHRRAALYRDKAEEARTIAEGMGDTRARATVLDVAEAWDRLADAEGARGQPGSN